MPGRALLDYRGNWTEDRQVLQRKTKGRGFADINNAAVPNTYTSKVQASVTSVGGWRRILLDYHPERMWCQWLRSESSVGHPAVFKFYELRQGREERLQVGYTRIMFNLKPFGHSLEMKIDRLDLILS